ncbi:Metal-dependent hydrolase, endonuclease/exonuclease/phosphatase family [Formivibrio citricus]|uniref:Metal-dependent hydrolase, endonuclease/exonuclease/phosphatase family n=1 Tax=Formivibrio citricus TaxID=83765 RepID=A0A1I4XDD8_9NEIS|nr:endonuclease/exonuclease/phosphatase family protein [Formivibrio citricus]SFN23907.1 Metal-dependent hydrolase, endonuclease/exonuclease/phosphatase family [Formivibrio citricus]
MEKRLRVASYNIHKGVSFFNGRLVLHEVRQELSRLAPDLVFLQEVQGEHRRRASRFAAWPQAPQHEFLAGDDLACVYGRNANYHEGHHGNALLSRYPVLRWQNVDLTLHRREQRGLLHCVLQPPGWNQPLHALCVHLNLLARDRRKQLALLSEHVETNVPAHEPLLLAGDFNDWRREATHVLASDLGLAEAFETLHGAPARSFPARLPLLQLDRIYSRGFSVEEANVLAHDAWVGLSDHAPLFAVMHYRG